MVTCAILNMFRDTAASGIAAGVGDAAKLAVVAVACAALGQLVLQAAQGAEQLEANAKNLQQPFASARMKACTIAGYEDLDSLTIDPESPRPAVAEPGTLLVKTCAVSLAPGDVRVLSGMTSLMQAPKRFPYVPGGDSSGVVVEVYPRETRFRVGDRVACVFPEPRPFGALAEFRLVPTKYVAKIPDSVSMVDASTVPSSGLTAYSFKEHVRTGDRVVVINACGGVGCFLLQLLKREFGAPHGSLGKSFCFSFLIFSKCL